MTNAHAVTRCTKPKRGYEQFNGTAWFSQQALPDSTYEKSTALILDPYFGLGGRDDALLGLHMDLSTAEYGVSMNWYMRRRT